MKKIKTFIARAKLEEAIETLESNNIQCNTDHDGNEFVLYVHVGDFIRARDIIIELSS